MAYGTSEIAKRNRDQSCWKKRTCMERCGIVLLPITLIIILLLALVILLLVFHKTIIDSVNGRKDIPEEKPLVCLTSGCIQTAANVLQYIDQSLDPCDDFYQFACGGFIRKTTIPDDKMQMNSFILANSLVQEQLISIIEEPLIPNEPRPFTLLKKLYKICLNTTAVEDDGLKTIRAIIQDLGGWPVLENEKWNENNFDWKESVAKFRKYGFSTNNFLGLNVLSDPKNSSRRILHLDQADLELSRESLLKGLDDDIIKAYYNYMVNAAILFGANTSSVRSEVKAMLDFKIELAKISLPQEKRRNESALYNLMTVRELQDRYPTIAWLKLINNVIALPDKVFTINDTVIVDVPQYIQALEVLLKNTSKRAQANHAIFQAVRLVESLLPEEIRKLSQQFQSRLHGTQKREPKSKECISVVSSGFNLAMGGLYARRFFDEDMRNNALEMVSDLRKEFVNILKRVDWMDETTKKTAINKALAITAHIAYPEELLDDRKLEDYYSDLEINSENYLLVVINISRFRTDKIMRGLWQPVNKTDWTTRASPTTINAFYSLTENSIQFPAAILQGMFFNTDRPRSMNYGGIGTIIGHEMTHGFDDEGKQYDKHGNLVNWWANATDKAFNEKTKCIIDQYQKYIVPEVGLHLNGINTQGENIADNGGVKEAYLAYSAWIERNGEEAQLPGLNYTAKQLFWISTANCWCTKDRKESLIEDVLTDAHAPARYRILIPFGNSEYFSKDFQCPSGSKMNPIEKCHVW